MEGWGLSCGSPVLQNFIAPYTADLVSSLLSGGAFIVGKTRMDEFGMGSHSVTGHGGPVRTNTTTSTTTNTTIASKTEWKSPGGSSGGTAVALSQHEHINLGVGSDTGGSIRTPAAFMDLIGFKPSYSSFSRHGLVSYASSLDCIALMAKNAKTLLKVYNFLSFEKLSANDPLHCPVSNDCNLSLKKGNVVGYFSTYGKTNVKILSEIEKMKLKLSLQGFTLKKIDPSLYAAFESKTLVMYLLQSALEAKSCLARYPLKFLNPLDSHKTFGPVPRRRVEFATSVYSPLLMRILEQERSLLKKKMEAIFACCDYLLTPTTPDLPPMISVLNGGGDGVEVLKGVSPPAAPAPKAITIPESTERWDKDLLERVKEQLLPTERQSFKIEPSSMDDVDTFTVCSNLAGLPSISVPSGHGGIGLQFISSRERERSLIEIADLLSK